MCYVMCLLLLLTHLGRMYEGILMVGVIWTYYC